MTLPTVQEFRDAKQDLDDLAEVINSPSIKDVLMREGRNLPTLTKVIKRLNDHAPVRNRGLWLSGITYEANDIWKSSDGVWYVALEEYIAGATEQVDIDTNKVFVHQATVKENVIRNIAELRAYNGFQDGEYYRLLGYIFPGIGGGDLYVDGSDTASPDDGGMCFVVGEVRVKRPDGYECSPADFGALTSDADASVAIVNAIKENQQATLNNKNYLTLKKITLSNGDHLSGGSGQLAARITTAYGFDFSGAFASISNIVIDTGSSDSYAINLTNNNGYADFGNHVNGVRTSGLKGIKCDAYETKIEDCYLIGNGSSVSDGIGIGIDQFDTSIDNVILQDYEIGVETFKGLQSNDLHIVRCDRALTIREQGEPTQLVNTYIDTPRYKGIRLFDQKNCVIVNTQLLKIGTSETASTSVGIELDSNSSENAFVNTNFNQPLMENVASMITFELGSINNVFFNLSGDYKLSMGAKERIRWQTVLSCTGGWARHNNIPRKNRCQASGVAPMGQVTLNFQLDYKYPEFTFNTLLFYGKYVSRNASSQGSIGHVYIPIQYDDTGCDPTLTPITGHVSNSWSIVSSLLQGDVLSVVFKNEGTSPASISVEIERSLDSNGNTF